MHEGIFSQQHRLAAHPEVPASARRQAEEAASDHDEKESLALRHAANRSREVSHGVVREVRALLGDEDYATYRHLLRTERQAARERLQPPEGLVRGVQAIERERKNAAVAFLRKKGVEPERLKEVLKSASTRFELARHHSREKLAKVYTRDKYLDHFGDPAVPDPHGPQIFRPPYAGWQAGLNAWGSVRWGERDLIDANAGLVGHDITLDDDDASDWDFSQVVADAQIVFWFKPPATGIVEAVLEVQAMQALHHVCTEDEWGWSDSTTVQFNYLMMHVLHPNVAGPSFAEASSFEWETSDDQCTDRVFLPSGARFFTRLTSEGAVPAGEWIAIRAGTRTDSRVGTNDVTVHSLARFQYLVNSVAVRILP